MDIVCLKNVWVVIKVDSLFLISFRDDFPHKRKKKGAEEKVLRRKRVMLNYFLIY